MRDFLSGLSTVVFNRKVNFDILKSEFENSDVFFANYSRTAICLILRSLDLPKGSKVGVPLYSCTVVFDAIVKAGLVPKFIDINKNYTLDPEDLKRKVEDIDALIVIHTFGRPADMDEIKKIASNIPIIEDCAHSIFSMYKGKQTGILGDFSVFSLPKYLSAGGGGMVLVNNKTYVDSLAKYVDSLDSPSFIEDLTHLFVMYVRSFFYHKPWFGLMALPIGLSVEDKIDLMDKTSFAIKKINKSDLYLANKKILDFKSKIREQRKKSAFLLDELKGTSYILPLEKEDTYCNYYLFPLQVQEKETRDKVCESLRNEGIDTSKLFSQTPEIARLKYGYENDCPYTEQITSRIFTVPAHYTMSQNELFKVAKLLRQLNKP
jgi:dTDP-4-amino-4,6-dideoxygalactose transaminase